MFDPFKKSPVSSSDGQPSTQTDQCKPLVSGNWKPLRLPSCQLAESPRWFHDHWVWLDIDGKAVHRCTTANLLAQDYLECESLYLTQQTGCVLPTFTPLHYVLFGRESVDQLYWPRHSEVLAYTRTQPLAVFEKLHSAPFDSKRQRFNDGRGDSRGRAWVSSMSDAREAEASLYCITAQGIESKLSDLIVGNGLAFSPDSSKLYLSDTRHRKIWKFDFDLETGAAFNREVLADYGAGPARPDGACMLEDGSLLSAVYEGGRLDRWSPEGDLIESIEVPFSRPTMPCMGGPNLQQLLVCSAPGDDKMPNRQGFEKIQLAAIQATVSGVTEPRVMLSPPIKNVTR